MAYGCKFLPILAKNVKEIVNMAHTRFESCATRILSATLQTLVGLQNILNRHKHQGLFCALVHFRILLLTVTNLFITITRIELL